MVEKCIILRTISDRKGALRPCRRERNRCRGSLEHAGDAKVGGRRCLSHRALLVHQRVLGERHSLVSLTGAPEYGNVFGAHCDKAVKWRFSRGPGPRTAVIVEVARWERWGSAPGRRRKARGGAG